MVDVGLPSVRVETRDVPQHTPFRGRALILPGARYSVDRPLLSSAAAMLERRGWQVSAVRWDLGEQVGEAEGFVVGAAEQLAEQAPNANRTLVVGKSLASHAAGWAVARGYPSVWLTPLLTAPAIRDAIGNSTNPTLLIGGTSDDCWDRLPQRDGLEILEVEKADHGLRVPDRRESDRILDDVTARIERFAAAIC